MEIKIGTQQILKLLHIFSWIIFIGLCIDAGGFIFNTTFSYFKPIGAQYYWNHLNLSDLYKFDKGRFLITGLYSCIVVVLKAILFYLIVKVFLEKKVNLAQPFNNAIQKFILNSAYLTFGIGLFSSWGTTNVEWLISQGVKLPSIQDLKLGGADVWFFMSIFLFVIAQIFKRGIELQEEHELTI